jgi:hypothetical protein
MTTLLLWGARGCRMPAPREDLHGKDYVSREQARRREIVVRVGHREEDSRAHGPEVKALHDQKTMGKESQDIPARKRASPSPSRRKSDN